MSLVSRHLEANGIPTAVIGSARDIVEECGVARFIFTDFPLGNPCGKPRDPFRWQNDAWRGAFMRVDESNRGALARAGEERRQRQAAAKTGR